MKPLSDARRDVRLQSTVSCHIDQRDAAGGVVPGEYVFDARAEKFEHEFDRRLRRALARRPVHRRSSCIS